MALHCVWSTNSAKDAILKAVNMCGDADSVGAVTGQIAGAAYGFSDFPKDWISTVNRWDNHEIGLRAFRLYHKIWKN
jgi:ADP-ribosyl-[dinitrogen reductase] hydrolase